MALMVYFFDSVVEVYIYHFSSTISWGLLSFLDSGRVSFQYTIQQISSIIRMYIFVIRVIEFSASMIAYLFNIIMTATTVLIAVMSMEYKCLCRK